MEIKKNSIGIALGGGGARGLAHIGVLKVFEDESIPIDLIVGTSVGALVGGAYASGSSWEEIKEKVIDYINSPEFQSSAIKAIEMRHASEEIGIGQKIQGYLKNRFFVVQAMFRPGVLSNDEFSAMINYFIPDIEVEDTVIPYRAVATDLVSGEQIIFASGSLRHAVTASCSVPGAMRPLKEGERVLLDGGIICLIPGSVARKEGAGVVIAVSVDRDVCTEKEFRNTLEVYLRVSDIMSNQLKNQQLADADVIIRPEVGDLHWSEFSQALSLIEEGERAARAKLPEIQKARPGIKKWFIIKDRFKSRR